MRMPAFAALGLSAFLASCAPLPDSGMERSEAAAPARQCFFVSQVNNFRVGRANELYLRVGRNDVYEARAAGGCTDLDFALQLALIPDGGIVGSRLCTGDWARVVVPGAISPTYACRVQLTRRLTAEEVAALPAANRP